MSEILRPRPARTAPPSDLPPLRPDAFAAIVDALATALVAELSQRPRRDPANA